MALVVRFSAFLGRFMAWVVLAVAAIALFFPESCLWVPVQWVSPLLALVMFGMGLTLKADDFKVLVLSPRDVIIGCFAQFVFMPALAFAICWALGLDQALMAGVILVGACPGGTASNVITYLAKGDVALSVGITAINTLLAPLMTPFIVWLMLGAVIHVDFVSLCLSIVQVVVVPVLLGFLLNRYFGAYVQKAVGILPGLSVIVIALIVAIVVSRNAGKIFDSGVLVFSAVILHNLLGYALGFGVAKLAKMSRARMVAMTVEVGMQNSGLASALAGMAFPALAMAAVPGAVFSVWHNISGAILATLFQRWKGRDNQVEGDGDER
ncbi:MAG: bile acid:sodium symporter family protein [Oxalobacter sp.]|nr:bile acid:sodium symporter family protein [Oxalobacter sp.]